jgi:Rap1a immunity proteins
MSKLLLPLATAGAVLLSSGAHAEDAGRVRTVQELFYDCRSSDLVRKVECLNYLSGVADAIANLSGALVATPFCTYSDERVTYGQALEQFKSWAARNPKHWQEPAWLGVDKALVEAWPCRKLRGPNLTGPRFGNP